MKNTFEGSSQSRKLNYKQDYRYKKYALAIEKNLQLFEAIAEWADIISFLTKFCKTLQSFPNFHSIPKKVLVSKRLAQCLNPALPSGVHQKALETYAIIFGKLSKEKLIKDFYIYSYGILPFFRHCSLTVKNTFLSIFKEHLLPLCVSLPSALKSLMLSLLPALEEEGNEYFDMVLELLISMKNSVKEYTFYRCLWNCLLYSSMQRLSIITFLSRASPSSNYFEHATEEDKNLIITSIGVTLNDSMALVVRGSLEFIIKYLPINTKHFSHENAMFICQSVLRVFLKRDISLSRRCITWINSNHIDSTSNNELSKETIDLISNALRMMLFTKSDDPMEISIPFKILVALLDRPEMGLSICKQIMMDIIISIYIHCDQKFPIKTTEILEAANIFFEIVDLHVVWSALYKSFSSFNEMKLIEGDKSLNTLGSKDLLPIYLFAIKYLKISDNEAEHIHLPFFLYKTLYFIKNYCLDDVFQDMIEPDYAIRICVLIIEKIPQSYFKVSSKESDRYDHLTNEEINLVLDEFYQIRPRNGSIKLPSPKTLFESLIYLTFGIMKDTFALIMASQMGTSLKEEPSKLFNKLSLNFVTFVDWVCVSYATIFQPKLEDTKLFIDSTNFALNAFLEIDNIDSMSAIVRICIKLCKFGYYKPTLYPIFSRKIPRIYEELWRYFDLERDIQRLRIVQLFWSIHLAFPSDEMDRFFSLLLGETEDKKRIVNFSKFAKFWEISNSIPFMSSTALKKCLFIMINALDESNISIRRISMNWLSNAIPNCSRLLDPLLVILSDHNIVIESKSGCIFKDNFDIMVYCQSFNCAQVLYALNCLLSLSRGGSSGVIDVAKKQAVISDLFLIKYQSNNTQQFVSYAELLFDTITKFIFAEVDKEKVEDEIIVIINSIQMASLEFISLLMQDSSFITVDKLDSFVLSVVRKLMFVVHHGNLDMQPMLLKALLKLCRKSLPSLTQLWNTSGSNSDNLSSFQLMILDALNPANEMLQQCWIEFIFSFFSSRETGSICLFPILNQLSIQFNSLITKSKENFNCNEAFASLFHEQILILRSFGAILDFLLSYGKNEFFEQSIFAYAGGMRLWSDHAREPVYIEYSSKVTLSDDQILGVLKDIFISFLDILIVLEDLPVNPSSHEELYLEHSKKILSEEISTIIKCLFNKNCNFYYISMLSVWSTRLNVDLVDKDLVVNLDMKEILWIIDIVNMAPYQFISKLLECYRENFIYSSSKSKIPSSFVSSSNINELSVLLMIEAYVNKALGVEKIIEIWPLFVSLHKDCLGSVERRRASFLGLIRWLRVMILKINSHAIHQTLTADEKKISTEQQALLCKIIDSTNTLTAKGLDPHFSIRKKHHSTEADSLSTISGTPASTSSSSFLLFSFKVYSGRIVEDSLFSSIIFTYYTVVLIPQLTDLVIDNEKVTTVLQSIIYYLVSPQLRTRLNFLSSSREGASDLQVIFDLLYSISQIGSSVKLWKREMFDIFMDSKFFTIQVAHYQRRHFVNCIIRDDSEKLQDLISRISASVSSNIFTNRDLENANRSLNIKRLAYAIYCGEEDQYLPLLPSIQEKIVEIFKSLVSKVSTIPIYLLLRIILLKFSNQYLSNLWPIVFTEIIQNIRNFVKPSFKLEQDGELENIYAICKFIELMYKVSFEEIQQYQWIFVKDSMGDLSLNGDDIMGLSENNGLIGKLYCKLFDNKRKLSLQPEEPEAIQEKKSRTSEKGENDNITDDAASTISTVSFSSAYSTRSLKETEIFSRLTTATPLSTEKTPTEPPEFLMSGLSLEQLDDHFIFPKEDELILKGAKCNLSLLKKFFIYLTRLNSPYLVSQFMSTETMDISHLETSNLSNLLINLRLENDKSRSKSVPLFRLHHHGRGLSSISNSLTRGIGSIVPGSARSHHRKISTLQNHLSASCLTIEKTIEKEFFEI